jgi:hypothetical protein
VNGIVPGGSEPNASPARRADLAPAGVTSVASDGPPPSPQAVRERPPPILGPDAEAMRTRTQLIARRVDGAPAAGAGDAPAAGGTRAASAQVDPRLARIAAILAVLQASVPRSVDWPSAGMDGPAGPDPAAGWARLAAGLSGSALAQWADLLGGPRPTIIDAAPDASIPTTTHGSTAAGGSDLRGRSGATDPGEGTEAPRGGARRTAGAADPLRSFAIGVPDFADASARGAADAAALTLHGRLSWSGELAPGVPATLVREDDWANDRRTAGRLTKGTVLDLALSLPQLGELRIRAVGHPGSVPGVRIEPVDPAARRALGDELDALRERMRDAGLGPVELDVTGP